MPVAHIEGFTTRRAPADRFLPDQENRNIYVVQWAASPLPPTPTSSTWALLGADALGLCAALEAAAVRIDRYADLTALKAAVAQGASVPSVIAISFSAEATEKARAVHDATHRLLALLQEWLADERLASCSLVSLTRRAIATQPGEGGLDLVHAPLWGLVRTAKAEHPDRPLVLIDIDDSQASLRALPAALASFEPQIALRDGTLLVPRLARSRGGDVLTPPAGAPAWRLHIHTKGTFEGLTLVAHPDATAPLAPGQIRLAVHAAGLNFREVLNILGMYPGEAPPLGSEGAGVVTEVGPGVTNFAPGDRVMGTFSHAFGPIAVADQRTVIRMPTGWSFAQAAAVPAVFLTAYYALIDLGRLKPGERLLIHAAAGGVGMAAVQLARHLGAEVFGTASAGKWDTLRTLGLDAAHLASSRSLDFEEHFQSSTQGRGMDVVLNSLAREFVDASLRLLPQGGRFLEMGKTDIRSPDAVARSHPGVAYRAFDIGEAGPERLQQMLTELVALFERGVLQPLPVTTWDIARAPEAFRFFSQARHVGKLVLTLPRPLDPNGTVLITGGTGALGAHVARHLVAAHGARHLLLTSRSGPAAPGADALQRELTAAGADVTLAACDAADRDALKELLAAIPPAHPLTSVVHMAGILDDGLLRALTPERVSHVLRPKVDAALHLHELTQALDLSMFVLFSSLASVLGSPGQASYAAANAFLDALASHRHALGLSALSLAFGPWADEGMFARLSDADRARMRRQGVPPLSSEDGLALFDIALLQPDACLIPVRFDTAALRARADALPSVLRGLVRTTALRPVAEREGALTLLKQRLATLSDEGRDRALLALVCTEVATVLGLGTPNAIEQSRPLEELGLDSLMAVELRNRLDAATSLRLPVTLLFDHPTPIDLVRRLRAELVEDNHVDAEPGLSDAEIRSAIASIPIIRLREAGLLEDLLRLTKAQDNGDSGQHKNDESDALDTMTVDDLVRRAFNDLSTS
jgi:NADPH:quinone reductase-like Zn-dependent oxidoreductase